MEQRGAASFRDDRLTRFLLDSHVFLWFTAPVSKLRPESVNTIREADEVFISAATIWELTIKQTSGKLTVESLIEKRRAMDSSHCRSPSGMEKLWLNCRVIIATPSTTSYLRKPGWKDSRW